MQTDWGYHGKHEHLWGDFQFHGKPVYGNSWTLQGVPTDKSGRNVYVDYALDGTWKRENSFLTHRQTGALLLPVRHPGRALRRASRDRRTARP